MLANFACAMLMGFEHEFPCIEESFLNLDLNLQDTTGTK